jgi:hypothetical protein
MALIITMLMLTFITMAATMLWVTTRDEMLISGNMRRATISKHAAASGVSHFMASSITYDDLREMSAGRQEFVVIPKARIPDTKMFYEVKVTFCCDRSGGDLPDKTFMVVSEGQYGNDDKVLALHTISVTIETRSQDDNLLHLIAPVPTR